MKENQDRTGLKSWTQIESISKSIPVGVYMLYVIEKKKLFEFIITFL